MLVISWLNINNTRLSILTYYVSNIRLLVTLSMLFSAISPMTCGRHDISKHLEARSLSARSAALGAVLQGNPNLGAGGGSWGWPWEIPEVSRGKSISSKKWYDFPARQNGVMVVW
jgi:hypothetical protein